MADRVFITRSLEDAVRYRQAFDAAGLSAAALPVTRREREPSGPEKLRGQMGADWWAMTSPFAATMVAETLKGQDSRPKLTTIGNMTAEPLLEAGLTVEFIGSGVSSAMFAGELLDFLPDSSRVIVPRAEDGLTELEQSLASGHHNVEPVVLYRTVINRPASVELERGLKALRASTGAIVCLFAPSQLRALRELLGEDADAVLTRQSLWAIGQTTAAAVQGAGLPCQVMIGDSPEDKVQFVVKSYE